LIAVLIVERDGHVAQRFFARLPRAVLVLIVVDVTRDRRRLMLAKVVVSCDVSGGKNNTTNLVVPYKRPAGNAIYMADVVVAVNQTGGCGFNNPVHTGTQPNERVLPLRIGSRLGDENTRFVVELDLKAGQRPVVWTFGDAVAIRVGQMNAAMNLGGTELAEIVFNTVIIPAQEAVVDGVARIDRNPPDLSTDTAC